MTAINYTQRERTRFRNRYITRAMKEFIYETAAGVKDNYIRLYLNFLCILSSYIFIKEGGKGDKRHKERRKVRQ